VLEEKDSRELEEIFWMEISGLGGQIALFFSKIPKGVQK
jgi:hypothetical protein